MTTLELYIDSSSGCLAWIRSTSTERGKKGVKLGALHPSGVQVVEIK